MTKNMTLNSLNASVLDTNARKSYIYNLYLTNGTFFTGLDNFVLSNLPRMNAETIDMICGFLSRVPSPICLVAHNGYKFDFPLLKKEIFLKSKLVCTYVCSYLDIIH